MAADITGATEQRSVEDNRYIPSLLTLPLYPGASPLSTVDTVCLSEALMDIFSRNGVPEEIISDGGTQFASQMMEDVRLLLSIRHLDAILHNTLYIAYNGFEDLLPDI